MTEQTQGYNFDDDTSLSDEQVEMPPETAAEDELAGQKESTFNRLKSSGMLYNIIIGVVIFVAIILFYKMFFAGPSKPAAAPEAPNFDMQLSPVSAPQPSSPSASGNAEVNTSGNYIMLQRQDLQTMINGFINATTQNSDTLNAEVGKVQASLNNELENQVTNNQEITAMQQEIQQINSKFDSYNQNLTQIAKALDATQSQLQLIMAQTAQDATQLNLRAVVPGRAWLVDAKGNTTTVTVGSMLPYYGKVVSIDADAGKVTMSSGFVFQ